MTVAAAESRSVPVPREALKPLVLVWLRLIVVFGALGVLGATLFPFAPETPGPSLADWRAEVARRVEWRVPSRGGAADFLGNALLFVPLGFGLAGLAVALGKGLRRQIIGAGLMCVSLAAVIEVVQLTIPSRDPAVSDVLANGAGGVGGAIIWRFAGRRMLRALAGLLAESGSGYFSASRIGVAFVLYASLGFAGSLISARTQPFAAWAEDARLSVGAASAGEWGGRVSDLLIADSAMTPPAVEAAVRGIESGAIAPEGVFTFDPDSQAKSASQDVGREVTRRVVASSQFTVAATLSAAEPEKPGQSHIVKLGTDIDQDNVSLLQQDAHLIVRFNSPLTGTTGEHPQFLLPYLFADGQPHRVCISFDGRALRTHADGRLTGAVDMSPETLLTWRILPFRPVYMVLGRTDTRLWRLAYDVAVFAPLGILAGLFALATPHSARFRVLAFVSAVSLPPLAMQIVVGSMSGVGGTWWWSAASGIVTAAAAGIVAGTCALPQFGAVSKALESRLFERSAESAGPRDVRASQYTQRVVA